MKVKTVAFNERDFAEVKILAEFHAFPAQLQSPSSCLSLYLFYSNKLSCVT